MEQLFMIKGGFVLSAPKVDSAVVPSSSVMLPWWTEYPELFLSVCSDLFSQRRKTVAN